MLLDALTDPQIGDGVKSSILQALTARDGFHPYDADMGGRLLRLAAGGCVQRKAAGETAQRVVQAAADALMPSFPKAPQVLLPLYIAYLDAYGLPQRRERAACAAALEVAFHAISGRTVNAQVIAAKNGASPRLCRMILRRLERVRQKMEREGGQGPVNTEENQEAQDEVHDFDREFERYVSAWMKQNAEKYGNNMDVIEGMMPDIYMEFLEKPAAFLDGLAPQDYFEQYDDAQMLVSWLCQYVSEHVPVPDLLPRAHHGAGGAGAAGAPLAAGS